MGNKKAEIRWLLVSGGLSLVTLLAGLAYLGWQQQATPPVPVTLVTVEQGKIESLLNQSGTVELQAQRTLKSPIQGAVEQVLVKPGDRVQTGQTLIILRLPQRETALTNQDLQIRQQELTLNRNQQRITEAEEKLAFEQAQLQNLRRLVQAGALSQRDFQAQEDRVRTAQIALRDAQTNAASSGLDVQRNQVQRQQIERQLQDSVLTAPVDGVILDVKVQDGDGVELRTDLLTLGSPSQEYIQLQLSTLDATQIKVNQPVRVSVIGPNPEIYTGRIQRLHPQAIVPDTPQSRQNNRNQADQASVPATVRLDRPSRSLIPGGQVNVEIVLESQPNAIILKPEAIQRQGKQAFVWIRDGQNQVQQRPITTGIDGLLKVEVTSGLKPGDQVVLPSPDIPLKPGMKIVPKS